MKYILISWRKPGNFHMQAKTGPDKQCHSIRKEKQRTHRIHFNQIIDLKYISVSSDMTMWTLRRLYGNQLGEISSQSKARQAFLRLWKNPQTFLPTTWRRHWQPHDGFVLVRVIRNTNKHKQTGNGFRRYSLHAACVPTDMWEWEGAWVPKKPEYGPHSGWKRSHIRMS